MKPQELRPGNFLGIDLKETPENFHTVTEVGHTVQAVDCLYSLEEIEERRCQKEYFDIGDMEPIPMSKEWLTKLGFTESAKGNWKFPNGWGYVSFQNDVWYVFMGSTSVSKTYKFVHELQNLYFAMTGEELIIKK